MSQHNIEEEAVQHNYNSHYGGKHPIPTIQGYREHRKELDERYKETEEAQHEPQDDSRPRRAFDTAKTILKGNEQDTSGHETYPAANRNDELRQHREDLQSGPRSGDVQHDGGEQSKNGKKPDKSATEQAAGALDPREKRKAMKHSKGTGGRQVTDPVTHLPILIHDQTDKDLDSVQRNNPAPGSEPRTATGVSGATKSRSQLNDEQKEMQRSYNGMQKTFPPPDFKDLEKELASVYRLALTVGLTAILALALGTVVTSRLLQHHWIWFSVLMSLVVALGGLIVFSIQGWLSKKVSAVCEEETWDASRQQESDRVGSDSELPESVQWLNSFLTSVWPLINPDLFASLVDTLEDVMQASLPKIVRMVSVDDMGQGTEALRILGIKWLPTGAASQSVDDKGQLEAPSENTTSDRTSPGDGQQDQSASGGNDQEQNQSSGSKGTAQDKKLQEQEQEAMRAGMEAEQGDFVNMELAFAYRALPHGKSIASKAKNAHLYLKFYFPGGIAIPVWVELKGIMGIMRVRMQLTPDPPFFSVCTFTFLGQPKADLSCVPLSKHSLNVMDVPLISSFVQSAIDAALAEYVAPKSLTLDLKDLMMGEDFKKDTVTKGVVWIYIKQARGFKQGDGGFGPFEGASDSYVTVSWGKFGKPVVSTRIIVDNQAPNWHEWASILVTADELNAKERLRLQLWDSDKWTADDDLGRVEVDLQDLMHNPDTKNKMCDREDRFKGDDSEEDMPGTLTWAVGYFEKTRITDMQLQKQTYDKAIRNKRELKKQVGQMSENKLREAKMDKDHDDELHQQKVQDYKEQEDNMIISAPPSPDHLSGVLGIQIHNITGLEVQRLNKQEDGDQKPEDEEDEDAHLPDSYCTIILNHRKIYKSRTKPKNSKPFFNAGTERFVKDWTSAEVIISVRDSREKEDDALLGVVYLPLKKIFEKRSQIMDNWPLAGGVGYGRARISLIWRSIELQLPPSLNGWDYGTLEIKNGVRTHGHLEESLKSDRIKIRTTLSKAKMRGDDGQWHPKHQSANDSVFLAVRKRYSTAVIIEFRKSSLGLDKTPAFAVLWLSEIPDEEDKTMTLTVWKGGKKNLARAEVCCDYQGLEEGDQRLGEIELTVKFWRGLSGYHKSHASKSQNADVRGVMECLDTINDENMDDLYSDSNPSDSGDSDDDTETENGDGSRRHRYSKSNGNAQDPEEAATRKKLRAHTNQSDEGDENSGTQSRESGAMAKVKAPVAAVKDVVSKVTDKMTGDQNIEKDGSRGLRAQAQDYKKNHKQLHRKHRGIMQWKSVRTLDWAGGKAKRAKSRVSGLFEHGEKDQGIETEI